MRIENKTFIRYQRAKPLTFEDFDPLHCDNCDEVIGAIYEFDMNGTYILCKDCLKQLQ